MPVPTDVRAAPGAEGSLRRFPLSFPVSAAGVSPLASASALAAASSFARQHFLYFSPDPQEQGSFRPIFMGVS